MKSWKSHQFQQKSMLFRFFYYFEKIVRMQCLAFKRTENSNVFLWIEFMENQLDLFWQNFSLNFLLTVENIDK